MRPLRRKTASEVLLNMKNILEESGKSDTICSDRGKEFVNGQMATFLKDEGILLKHPYTLGHCPHVERVGSVSLFYYWIHNLATSDNNCFLLYVG